MSSKTVRKHPYRRFAEHLLRALPFIIIATIVSTVLEKNGWLSGLETAALDKFLASKASSPASHVVVVAISDDDHEEIFEGKTRLDPETVYVLVEAVARASPKVIGLDLATSAGIYTGLPPIKAAMPVIWARDATLIEEEESLIHKLNPFHHDRDRFELEPVLGMHGEASEINSGIARAPLDSDRSIRHYVREFAARREQHSEQTFKAKSFHWAVATAYCCQLTNADDCKNILDVYDCKANIVRQEQDEELILNVLVDPYPASAPISAGRVINELKEGKPFFDSQTGKQLPPIAPLLKDKIVLIGGRYQAACDEHLTPTGMEFGVDLVAQAVESEFKGGDIRPLGHKKLIALDVVSGIAFAILSYFYRKGWKRWLRVIAIPVIAIGASFLAFHSLAIWANFAPILFSVYLHNRYEHSKEDREEREDLDKAKRIVKKLRRRIAARADGERQDESANAKPE